MYYVYIIFSKKLTKYYKGHTNNLDDRLLRHNSGYEEYTKTGIPWILLWNTQKTTRSDAIKLEKKLN